MIRRILTSRHRRMWLVVLTCVCACVLLVWDRPKSSISSTRGDAIVQLYKESVAESHDLNQADVTVNLQSNARPLRPDPDKATDNSMINQCSGSPRQELQSVPAFPSSPIISQRHKLLYCPVGKVGSSYFTRLMINLRLHRDPQSRIESPLKIPITEAGRNRCDNLETLRSRDQQLAFLQRSELLVFGRDPYRRIFSAWLDKLYSPNPFYWRYWGKKAMWLDGDSSTIRKGVKLACPADVTFRQFVKLVVKEIDGLSVTDVHLRPVAEECRMCDLRYTLVAKIEETSKHLDLLASRINVTMTFHHEPDYHAANALDTVLDAVGGAFSWRHEILSCGVSLDRMGRSIWRKLQIRGVFDGAEPYPFKSGELTTNTPPERYVSACKDAISRSTDRERLKKQKEIALVEAYAQVDESDLIKIQQRYEKDFLLFGYDRRPAVLFGDRKKSVRTNALDWSVDWVL